MKIVFESEKEKNDILKTFAYSDMCPSDIGLTETFLCGNGVLRDECVDCWKNSGIEMVIGDSEDNSTELEARLERLRKFIMRIIRENDELEDAMHEAYGRCELTPNDIRFLNGLKEIEKKPPLGIMPKYIWDKKRLSELCEAVSRYWEAGEPIPIEWIEEYNELVGKANRRD